VRPPLFAQLERLGRLALFAALGLALACGGAREIYDSTGEVQEVAKDGTWIKIAHAEIQGFMPAMTMTFEVPDPAIVENVGPGSLISFRLERAGTRLSVLAIEVMAEGDGVAGRSGRPAPAVGAGLDQAPAFALVDQAGTERTLRELRGQAVLLDFVFTRCPGPCPAMTAARVSLQRALPAGIAERVHFVSITIDPEHDGPQELHAYAEGRGADLASWSFLGGEPDQVRAVLTSYGVQPQMTDAGLDHVLAALLIGPQGHVIERYLGPAPANETVIADLRRVLGIPG